MTIARDKGATWPSQALAAFMLAARLAAGRYVTATVPRSSVRLEELR